MSNYPFRYQSTALVSAPAAAVFSYMDDPQRLAAHMSESSWRMGGGSMQMHVDHLRGQAIGSHIRVAGKLFGIALELDEVVTERNRPHRKVWETTGEPTLLVIGAYRMGFELSPRGRDTRVRVFIEYALPRPSFSRVLTRLLGRYYAAWCTQRMANDTQAHFVNPAAAIA
jgi:hypothetical protein